MSGQSQLQDQLASFRQEWHEEIQKSTSGSAGNSARSSPLPAEHNNKLAGVNSGSKSVEERASKLFIKGVSLERNNKPYEAIRYYRQAMQLVPDIEFKINTAEFVDDEDDSDDDEESDSADEHSFAELSSMVEKFHQMSVAGHVCAPEFPPRMTHISVIPVELLVYIFKWVVSSELDFKSLENLAQVCRGFYACARDAEIWRLGCLRVWGLKCGFPLAWDGSWRLMFIQRPHVWTQGVYISNTSYVRQGEQSLDNFYRPYHLVEYYRYFRFFSNGRVLLLTTAEEPINIVNKLNTHNSNSAMMGHYRLIGDKVLVMINVPTQEHHQGRYKRSRRAAQSPYLENTLHIELLVQSTKRRHHNQLAWALYRTVKTYRESGQTVQADIDLTRQFPPLHYSPVKSFVQIADAPLG